MSSIRKTSAHKTGRLPRAELGAMKLRDIMTPDVLTLTQDQTLREAATALSEAGVSGAPVLSGGRTVGVISLSDIVDFAISMWPVPLRAVDWDELESRSGEENRDAPISYYTDLWSSLEPDVLEGIADAPEWDVLGQHTVGEAMTRKLEALRPDADVRSAVNRMLDLGIHRLLIIEDGELRGIVTTMDLLRLMADSRD